MMKIENLGYIGFEVSDVPAWERLAVDVLGLGIASRGTGGSVSFKMDDRAQRITVHPGTADDVLYMGFEVKDEPSLDSLIGHLEANGHVVRKGSEDTCNARKVERLIHLTDPDGINLELFVGLSTDSSPFSSPLVDGGFLTGSAGVGHFALGSADHEKKTRFYQEMLGMKLSDRIVTPGVEVTFLHANERHHTLGIANVELPKHVEHFMLQMTNSTDVGRTYQRCIESEVEIDRAMGQHPNDMMVSFYVRTPSGFAVEIGQGGLRLDDECWEVKQYDRLSFWGHQPAA